MLVSVLGRNQSDFDGLLAFYRMFTNRQGLMNWQLLRHRDGEVRRHARTVLVKLCTCSSKGSVSAVDAAGSEQQPCVTGRVAHKALRQA